MTVHGWSFITVAPKPTPNLSPNPLKSVRIPSRATAPARPLPAMPPWLCRSLPHARRRLERDRNVSCRAVDVQPDVHLRLVRPSRTHGSSRRRAARHRRQLQSVVARLVPARVRCDVTALPVGHTEWQMGANGGNLSSGAGRGGAGRGGAGRGGGELHAVRWLSFRSR